MDNLQKIEKLVNKAGCSYEEAKVALEGCDWDMIDAIIKLEREGKVKAQEAPKAEETPKAEAAANEATQEAAPQAEAPESAKASEEAAPQAEPKADTVYVDANSEEAKNGHPNVYYTVDEGASNSGSTYGYGNANSAGNASSAGAGTNYSSNSSARKEEFKKTGRNIWERIKRIMFNNRMIITGKNHQQIIDLPVIIPVIALIVFFWATLLLAIVAMIFGCRFRFEGEDLGKPGINQTMDKATDYAEKIKNDFTSKSSKGNNDEQNTNY